MNIWFSADPHYGHARIIELAKRPFSSVQEMDEELIRRHNERVKPGDQWWCVGDFAFYDHIPYLRRLNGQKFLVRGNHDHSNRVKPALKHWQRVHEMCAVTFEKGTPPAILCHYALRVWSGSHRGAIHLYGHSHGSLPGDSQSCDVGVDCWGFYPVNIEQIRERLAHSPVRGHPDHHKPKATA